MSVTKILSGLSLAVLVSGCADYEIDKLETMHHEGKEFSRHLSKEYLAFAKKESKDYNDFIDARHFAVKGQQAATGLTVLPEDPNEWKVPASELKELLDARERLTFALDKSGRADFVAPLASKAQVMYDCWVQEVEEANLFTGRPDQLMRCKTGFWSTIKALESEIVKRSPVFSLTFEKNSSNLTEKSMAIIQNIANVAKQLDEHTVAITGYTDAQGGRKSNLSLSQARAMAVHDALVAAGIDKRRMVAVGTGEIQGAQEDPNHRRVDVLIR